MVKHPGWVSGIICVGLFLAAVVIADKGPVTSDGPRTIIPFQTAQLIVPGIFFSLFVIAGLFFIIRERQRKGAVFEVISGLLSAGVGCVLGLGAQILYEENELFHFGNGYTNPVWIGGVAGGTFGLLAGIWFAQYLRGLLVQGRRGGVIFGKGILIGIGLGILCSVAVHAILMMAYHNANFILMLIGAGFGLGAGIAAGFFLCVCFIVGHKSGLIKVKENV